MNKNIENTQYNYITPATDIYEEEGHFVLQADIPGVTKDGLDVTLENNLLEITAKTDPELFLHTKESENEGVYAYRRSFKIDRNIDSQKISASLEDGVLTLELGKSEEVKPKKIEITYKQ
ncbi:MAG: Hsp20/alpha crystallin family protein [Spirochaetes bacterium]|jgi:HSP20 family protein|nr:Hsp20/alpha crystallin family protein [Spirochaetota bacterium]